MWSTLLSEPRPRTLVNIFNSAITYYIAAVAVAIGFKMKLFNIGVDGQYRIAAFAAALVAGQGWLPGGLNIVPAMLVAMLVGGFWAGIAGWLKVTRGVSEVISTIMLNTISAGPVGWGLRSWGTRAEGSNTRNTTEIPASSQLDGFKLVADAPNRVYTLLVLAILVGIVYWFVINRTRFGFDVRATGESETAAVASGVKVPRMVLIAMIASGAVAGLISMPAFFGADHSYGLNFREGVGFIGIGIALSGRNHPVGIAFAALLWSWLEKASDGLQLQAGVSPALVYIIRGRHPPRGRHRLRGRRPIRAAAGAEAGHPPARHRHPGRSCGMTLSVGTEIETAPATPATRRIPFWARPPGPAALLVVLSIIRMITGQDDISSSGTPGAALARAMPPALAGLGGLWSERAGVINIGLEGMMILGTGGRPSAPSTVARGWESSAPSSAAHSVGWCTRWRQSPSASTTSSPVSPSTSSPREVASYLAARFFGDLKGGSDVQSPPLPSLPRVGIPGLSDPLKSVEDKGWFFVSELAAMLRAATTDLSLLTVIALLLLAGTRWLLWRTAFGLRVRSCGESPVAAETLGINVYLYKYIAVTASGGLAGLGGGFLAMVASNAYREDQTGGRGYIGLAAMIFGNWRPGGVLMGSGLFGYMDALQLRGGGSALHAMLLFIGVLLLVIGLWQILRRHAHVQGTIAIVTGVVVIVLWAVSDSIPGEVTRFAPHLTTLLVLAFASQRLRMPAANGKVYRRGEGH
uniref:Uncharacterized protein n=1 Tax=Janibacter limosus TaxID=53458 RepID=A0AC61U8J8_9MICO|nr:hypothetical protein [Janibacter limosus]